MKTVKPQKLTTVPFVEGGNLNQILMQVTKPVRKVLFTCSGPIVITAQTGPVPVPVVQTAADGSVLVPYLLFLMGKLTAIMEPKDSSKGVKVQNIPIWLLWLEQYYLNGGVGATVNDGGMQAANFAPGTYQVQINFALNFYDPMVPPKQHPITYFRPVRYNNQPYFQIEGGKLFKINYQANNDNVALTGDTVTPTVLNYNTSGLTLYATAILIPDMPMAPGDICGDIAYEYIPKFNAKQTDYNGLSLSDLEVQQYITMINTDLASVTGGGTSYTEKGSATLGNANGGIIETDEGTDQLTYAYFSNLIQMDYDEFMKSVSAWPAGLLVIDEYGHNWAEWGKKTFLQPNAAQHLIQANGLPGIWGSNFRVLHRTANMSQTAKAGQVFPQFAGQ